MPHKCFLTGCKNYQSSKVPGLYFYTFAPIIRNKPRAKLWASVLDVHESMFQQKDVICSEHFSDDCFNSSDLLKQRLLPNSRFKSPRLLPHAVPFLSARLKKFGIFKRRKNGSGGQSKSKKTQKSLASSEAESVTNSESEDPSNATEQVDDFESCCIKQERVDEDFVRDIQNESSMFGCVSTIYEEQEQVHSGIQMKYEERDGGQFVIFDDHINEPEGEIQQKSPHFLEMAKCEQSHSNENLEQDISNHNHTCDIYKCHLCDFQNKNKMLLKNHIKSLHLNHNTCNNQHVCDKNCIDKLQCKICSKIIDGVKKVVKCERTVCNFRLLKKSIFISNQKTDNILFPCNQCFESFDDRNVLKDHLFKHYLG